ncbi:MAG: Lrp/AsnC family transcriptional regulator [Actinobacteria bacterium]|nr:Lrp/AsnC family transcriptional regulator [Actinomycetota bacterium]
MVTGCVLIELKAGKDREAFDKLKKLEAKQIYGLFGEYDVLMILEAENIGELTEFVIDNVRSIEGVDNTRTIITAEL